MSTCPGDSSAPFSLGKGRATENLPEAAFIDPNLDAPTPRYRYTRGFLTYYNYRRIRLLTQPQRSTVSGAQRPVPDRKLGEGKNSPGPENSTAADDHSSIVERSVRGED